jgi:DUF4097 and DUF4098 domain-containing protein YvlB
MMKSRSLRHSLSYILGSLLLVTVSGCNEELTSWGGTSQSKSERTITRQIALGGSDTLDVATWGGSVTVTGTDTADCSLEARIVAHAPTEEEAQTLAEQVEIVDQISGSTLRIRSREPDLENNRSISVSYTIAVPRRLNIQCDSKYGSLDISSVEGHVVGTSNNGSIKARDIQGRTDLSTSYGSIECRNVGGQSIRLHSSNGSITMANLRGSTTAETSYGVIACEGFADGDLKLQSGNGRIGISDARFGVCEAKSSYGAIAASRLAGDSIDLHSGNGSVEVDGAEAKTLNASSSYGRIAATGIAAATLKAESGNGSVHVSCAPAAPADLDAQLKSSYGSVELAAPQRFAGEVYLRTSYGAIHTDLPITASGELTKKKIVGRIGDGAGKIHMESGNGSVELK